MAAPSPASTWKTLLKNHVDRGTGIASVSEDTSAYVGRYACNTVYSGTAYGKCDEGAAVGRLCETKVPSWAAWGYCLESAGAVDCKVCNYDTFATAWAADGDLCAAVD